MKQIILALSALVLLAMTLPACGSAETSSGHGGDLAGTHWTLTNLAGAPTFAVTVITLDFAASRLNGSAGCNDYSGNYMVTEVGTLTVGELAQTAKACVGPTGIMGQERRYLDVLERATIYHVTRANCVWRLLTDRPSCSLHGRSSYSTSCRAMAS
jgi:heat shock protein HslJ